MIKNAVGASGTSVNYGGVTINVYAQPGQDISELADEIEERLTFNNMRRNAVFG